MLSTVRRAFPRIRSFQYVRLASSLQELNAADLRVKQSKSLKDHGPPEKLVFGKSFTDHMFEVEWDSTTGWDIPRIVPFHDLQLHPAVSSLHYGIQCFDGLKAYLSPDKRPLLFRPMENMKRLRSSSMRLGLPGFEPEQLLQCLKKLVTLEKSWIPDKKGYSLYIRPTAIATPPLLGVGAPSSALLFIIMSPVGPYYASGFKAVKLLAEEKYTRAWPGGTGDAKVGGNYALSIKPQAEAAAKGYTQVLWLIGKEGFVTEVGTMNMFVYWLNDRGEKELVTCPLDGTILPGVTRDSVLQLARSWGDFKVSERPFTIHELLKANKEGRVFEAFGTGTAAVVSPVSVVNFRGVEHTLPLDPKDSSAQAGPVARRVWETLLQIQYGEVKHPWSVYADE
eukprot:TRINITY_DN13467_c0_g1_i1.p1 TRINITY_DN13467_c0_g1~~TRINITY_DN13467_c0_g1_i1.p1  ORF type:complete len:394 (+),score=68.39 TRINITY_DN13467_c0_g1_i1:109-1290(+)